MPIVIFGGRCWGRLGCGDVLWAGGGGYLVRSFVDEWSGGDVVMFGF